MNPHSVLDHQAPSAPPESPDSEARVNGRPPARPIDPAPTRAPLPWLALAIVSVAVMALCFLQAEGRLLADTKLDLVVDPGGFLDRALHLWDSSNSFGQVQNQAVGYLFPMGPFFLLGDELGAAMWIVQRLWLGLVLIVAVWGVAALARQLGIGRPPHWVAAGAAYALSPFFLGQLTSISAAVLPAALLPWALVPLVHGSRGGSPRRAAALSGLAIAGMGGVNAAATAAVLPLPVIWLISRRPSPRRRALAGWWVLAAVLATAWWALPLLFQLNWGFNFLPFTETAGTTELATSAFEGVRGAGNWVAYLSLGGPWLPGAWALVSSAAVVVATAALAAIGFAGLARAGAPERTFLVVSVLVGAVLVCAGYLGPAGGLLDGPIRALLDGPLGAFRNVHKFEPLLRLPLALGLAAALAAIPRRLAWPALAGVAAIVLVAALPMLRGDLPQRGTFEQVPDSWRQAARFLDRHSGRGNALLVPAAPFGEYSWGRPLDEPLQPLARSPWAARSLIPLGGAGSTSLLDAVERRLQTGVSAPGLQQALARAGIRYVVARNDLDWRRADAPRPVEVHAVLRAAGLRRVASFGAPLPEPQARGSLVPELGIGRYESRLSEIEIFAVGPRTSRSLATTLPAARSIAVSGGPQSLPQLADQDLVTNRDPTFTVIDRSASTSARRWAVTDALRRTYVDFGLVRDNGSYTLAPGERSAGSLGPARQLLGPEAIEGHAAIRRPRGPISRVTASSYGSWLLQLPFVEPSNAFDGDRDTAWVTGASATSVGEWVRADFQDTIEPSGLRVRLLQDGPWRPRITELGVTTASGSTTSAVRPDESVQGISVPPGPTSWIRLTLTGVRRELSGGATAGLRDVQVLDGAALGRAAPGPARANQWVKVPEERSQLARARRVGSSAPAFSFSRLSANPLDVLRRDEESQLRRIFVMPKAARMRIEATALPERGGMLDRILTDGRGLHVSATSSWNELPGFRAANVIDGSRGTAWIAQPPRPLPTGAQGATSLRGFGTRPRQSAVSPAPALTDSDPRLQLRWEGPRSLSRLRILPAGEFASAPRRVHLASPAGHRDLTVPRDAEVIRFRALRTDRLTVSFPAVARRYTTTGIELDPRVRLPVGVAELDFPALRGLRVGGLGPDTVVRVPCGEGPPLRLDGQRLPTAVSARAGDLVQLRSVAVRICPGDSVELAAGSHRLAAGRGSAFTLSSLSLRPPGWAAVGSQRRPREVRIRRWNNERRSLEVGSGPAAYLAIRENFNRGWEATLGERRLSAIRLDGWQQGFKLPPGRGGVVELSFAPEAAYGKVLLLGAGLGLVLIALALVPGKRRNELEPAPQRSFPGGRWATAVAVAGATAAIALISWPALLAVPAAIVMARRLPRAMPWAAGGLVLVAAVVVAFGLEPHPLEQGGAFAAPAQLLTAVALALLAASLWIRRPEPRADAA